MPASGQAAAAMRANAVGATTAPLGMASHSAMAMTAQGADSGKNGLKPMEKRAGQAVGLQREIATRAA